MVAYHTVCHLLDCHIVQSSDHILMMATGLLYKSEQDNPGMDEWIVDLMHMLQTRTEIYIFCKD